MSNFYYKYVLTHVKNEEEEKMEKLCVRNWHIMFPSELEIAHNSFDCFCRKPH